MIYLYLMENVKPLTRALVEAHVAHLRALDRAGRLVFCGPFADYPGGIVVFRADSPEEAAQTAEGDPFIASGCKTFVLRAVEEATAQNHYLLEE